MKSSLKVLHINRSDIKGGAAKAAYRIHRGLLDLNVDSRMMVQEKLSSDSTIVTPYNKISGEIKVLLRPYVNSAILKLQSSENQSPHSVNITPSRIYKKIVSSDADIIHFHSISGETISISEISKIQKPIVWTLHDMWAFSGAEHYDSLKNPGRYINGYHAKNRSNTDSGFDIDRWTWKRKRKNWEDQSFCIITPSTWLEKCVKESKLLYDQSVQTIHNGLDLEVYKPIPKKWARTILNIPYTEHNQTNYILFGAMSATSDARKGFMELVDSINYLNNNNKSNSDFELLVFGSDGSEGIDFGLPTTYLGQLLDEETLVLAYSAADVMAVPSLQDNLPNTAVEAIACGTPVVAFDTGGLSDIVNHKENGYLVKPYLSEDFATGLKWVLDQSQRLQQLSRKARSQAEKKFEISDVAKQLIKTYDKLLLK